YDSKKNGILNTLKAGSMFARPTTVNDAPCSDPSRILRSTVGSSPSEPPLNTVTDTRPLVPALQSSPIFFKLLSQMEPVGTRVARLVAPARATTECHATPAGTSTV